MSDERRAGDDVISLEAARRRRAPRVKQLGFGAMAKLLGPPIEQTTGHWCSRCQGIWYGYLLEVACPACGNRHG